MLIYAFPDQANPIKASPRIYGVNSRPLPFAANL
jgi:hypothetical protein